MTAVRRWAAELAAWTIDPEILAAAPESPYGFPPGLFGGVRRPGRTVDTVRAAAPASVLDVGSGGGAASIPAGAAQLLAVDQSAELLDRYRSAAGSTPVRTWCGRWPDIAAEVPAADVVVAADVVYNVPDIAEFVAALTDHARRRVVVELSDRHPWTSMGALWRHFHGQERPGGPTAELFGEVLAELGIAAESATEPRPGPWEDAPADVVLAFTRRRLCLPASREAEVAEAMRRFHDGRPRTSTTYWWPGTAS
ncbi:class I SAM-dependent methyltransferase [Geodermatophilus ruber]|uniref:Methyltransferase domain-containing protein n=1 Tax=Geodermatophilus ruber TaxID=504800 RepID=A0A1I3YTC5_9ACTN|nr:class I SAM-dependent methyltransferase [Geodermatophilus ruber]SFK35065.1 Methyltransferase domain-containing protein [Geodermatophilus ruber]